jgi:NAD(P)-dependent dehydrogenase (short-subunit alcohol dehydrogenase family)
MEKIGIVTGGNRGIGLSLVRRLARDWQGIGRVYLTARDERRGREAVEVLRGEGLDPLFHALDVASAESIAAFATHIRSAHGGVDALIMNGAYAPRPDVAARDDARPMMETNNHGARRMIDAFRPLLRDGARLVLVASGFGTLASLPEPLHARFLDPMPDVEGVERIMSDYVAAAEAGTDATEGWPAWVNAPSKVGQVALVRAYAREMADEARARDILINAACPGWTWTDAARPYLEKAPNLVAKQPDEAAEDVIWLATLPPGTRAPYGELVQYRRVLPFVPAKPA